MEEPSQPSTAGGERRGRRRRRRRRSWEEPAPAEAGGGAGLDDDDVSSSSRSFQSLGSRPPSWEEALEEQEQYAAAQSRIPSPTDPPIDRGSGGLLQTAYLSARLNTTNSSSDDTGCVEPPIPSGASRTARVLAHLSASASSLFWGGDAEGNSAENRGCLSRLAAGLYRRTAAWGGQGEPPASCCAQPEEGLSDEGSTVGVSISPPLSVSHDLHCVFNYELARFEGLPQEWSACNRQFGVAFAGVPKMPVEGYRGGKIPAVLVLLKNQLLGRGGMATEGIFRLTPDSTACAAAKEQINSGTFDPSDPTLDVHIVATLLKAWFRECPDPLLGPLDHPWLARVAGMTDLEAVAAEVGPENSRFPLNASPQRGLFDWLLDLLAAVVMHEANTRMTAKCLAIVWAPNLVPPTHAAALPPGEARLHTLKRTEAALEFTRKVLLARLYTLGHVTARDTTAPVHHEQPRRGASGETGANDGLFSSPIALSPKTLAALASAGAAAPVRIPSSGAMEKGDGEGE